VRATVPTYEQAASTTLNAKPMHALVNLSIYAYQITIQLSNPVTSFKSNTIKLHDTVEILCQFHRTYHVRNKATMLSSAFAVTPRGLTTQPIPDNL
jgi:hypothetical protein